MGGKGSGRRPLNREIDYYNVRRIATARWLRAMRSPTVAEDVKNKMAQEVVCKDIGKTVNNNTTNVIQTPKTWEELVAKAKEINEARNRTDSAGELSQRPRVILPNGVGDESNAVSGGNNEISEGQPTDGGQVS